MELVQSQCGSWFVYSFCKLCPRPQKTQYVEYSKRRVRNWKNWGLIENHSKKFASLIVNASSDGGAEVVVVVEKPPKLPRFQVFDGSPTPFGATARDGGVNFAVYSSNALSATLCFMTLSDLHQLVAEAWDCGGLYQVGMFPHWGIWSEWNGKYRDIVRQYIKGTDGFAGAFAECLCGSPNLYQEGGRKPWNSINFVCAHDGFSLADLVMYNNKHNLANGEDNNDGENQNNSWHCGQEGEFASIPVKKLRKRQMRNFFLCLMVSQMLPEDY